MKKSNYISGQWVEGTSSIKNINPSDPLALAFNTSGVADMNGKGGGRKVGIPYIR